MVAPWEVRAYADEIASELGIYIEPSIDFTGTICYDHTVDRVVINPVILSIVYNRKTKANPKFNWKMGLRRSLVHEQLHRDCLRRLPETERETSRNLVGISISLAREFYAVNNQPAYQEDDEILRRDLFEKLRTIRKSLLDSIRSNNISILTTMLALLTEDEIKEHVPEYAKKLLSLKSLYYLTREKDDIEPIASKIYEKLRGSLEAE